MSSEHCADSPSPGDGPVTAILARYGYQPRCNRRGQRYFCGQAQWRGQCVRCCLGDPQLRALPGSLTCPVWVGYYGRDPEGAMLDDELVPSLLEFLRRQDRPVPRRRRTARTGPRACPPSHP